MAKVFVVVEAYEVGCSEPLGLFSTAQKAHEYYDEQYRLSPGRYYILGYELDDPNTLYSQEY